MKLTTTLINSLMDDLACLAISALGGYSEDGFSDLDRFFIKEYSKRTCLKLCDEMEREMGIKWEVVKND